MILECPCKHAFQDGRYGKGKRVHNLTEKSKTSGKPIYRCTVCGHERYASGDAQKGEVRK